LKTVNEIIDFHSSSTVIKMTEEFLDVPLGGCEVGGPVLR
jgi:hypothetical protein